MLLSIVITSYNRRSIIRAAIDSALQFIGPRNDCEIVLVDDASVDGTPGMIRESYLLEVKQGLIRICENAVNQGVTATKNRGAAESRGEWIMFLDSDDSLIPEKSSLVFQKLAQHASDVFLIFRCCSKTGKLIGRPQHGILRVDAANLVSHGFPGECLPIIKRDAFLRAQYDGDLRGFEFIGHYRLLSQFGSAIIFPDVVRVYDTNESGDRLSTKKGVSNRARLLAKGFYRLFKLSLGQVGIKSSFLLFGKSLWYTIIFLSQRLRRP